MFLAILGAVLLVWQPWNTSESDSKTKSGQKPTATESEAESGHKVQKKDSSSSSSSDSSSNDSKSSKKSKKEKSEEKSSYWTYSSWAVTVLVCGGILVWCYPSWFGLAGESVVIPTKGKILDPSGGQKKKTLAITGTKKKSLTLTNGKPAKQKPLAIAAPRICGPANGRDKCAETVYETVDRNVCLSEFAVDVKRTNKTRRRIGWKDYHENEKCYCPYSDRKHCGNATVPLSQRP